MLESIAGGATPRRSDDSLYADDGVRFFRILNVDDGEIVERDLKYVTDAVHNGLLERSQLAAGDVLMTITGRVGSAAVVGEDHLPANINQHIARLRVDRSRCRPEFLSEWLNCPAGLELSNRYVSGGTRAALDYGAIRNLRVPLPPLETQEALVAAMDAARAEQHAKLAEADALLAGIDDFLLDALGIAPPVEDRRRVFAVSLNQMSGQERLNSDYYHPERVQALQQLERAADSMAVAPLAEVVNFVREQLKTPRGNYLSLAHVQSHTGELTDTTDTASGNCFTFQANDVLFARLRPYLNKVYRAEIDGCCSTEFHVLRVKDGEALLPEYLAAILRSCLALSQTVHMMTGNTHPRLTNDDVENLTVPIPSLDVQVRVAAEIVRRREQARRLRAEAEAGWEGAKRWFEGRLLSSS
ncbi:MAG: hypothetical protein F4X64_00255 [Chloroflexi bacterium]|nr:hypothetical protein [Chloroflexota bacterium]